jgi:acetyltransferase
LTSVEYNARSVDVHDLNPMPKSYPAHLVSHWHASDGSSVLIRPIRPEDADIEREFVASLSPEARYMRFMTTIKELSPEMLDRFTRIDYDTEMALIAVVTQGEREIQIAVARYVMQPDRESCEFAIVVGAAWQGRGLGQHLMLLLIELARAQGLTSMTGQIFAANVRMLSLARAMGFIVEDAPNEPAIKHVRLTMR